MSLVPFNWSIVIVGRWNPAILTPLRISENVFGLAKGTPVEVMVPIDGLSPYQIKHRDQNIIFIPNDDRLQISLGRRDSETLGHALNAGIKVLEWLPVTPVSAAGFNINFRVDHIDAGQEDILANKNLDDKLSDLGFSILSRQTSRSISYKGGIVKVTVRNEKDSFEILFNFHRQSNSNADLIQWLQNSPSDIISYIRTIMTKFNMNFEEETNGGDSESAG